MGMVVGSKTGQCMPSEKCLSKLVETYGDLILPVVDACQGRTEDAAIRRHLDDGRAVLATGSKFFGGPPFAGLCLLSDSMAKEMEGLLDAPVARQMLERSKLSEYVVASLMSDDLPNLRSLLPERPLNYGALLRWTIALHGIEAYFAEVPAGERSKIMRNWPNKVLTIIED